MYMVRIYGELEAFGTWPIEGAETRAGETWVYFSSQIVAKGFARAHGGRLERARWEVDLAYQKTWTAKPVGEKWWIAPCWDRGETPSGRWRLDMLEGLVFGAGDHATTCASLELMETLDWAGKGVFDLGSGTGILSEAAHCLGAQLVVGCDLEADAARMTRDRGVLTVHGPSMALRDASFDILLVNIPGYVHLDLAPEYTRLLKPGGQLLLSGYYTWQAERIEAALPGFEKTAQIERGDGWVASIFSHARATASSAAIS
jgi:ribosomal protein L11 methyltransferase